MVKLYEFKPNSLILSSEVNANFSRLADVLGTKSTATTFVPPGVIAFGDRQAGTLSALTDRVAAKNGYVHIGWNARESYDAQGKVALNRASGLRDGSTVVRIGGAGFRVLATNATSGDITAGLTTQFSIQTNRSIYINPKLSFTSTNEDISDLTLDDYRLTYIPFATPVRIEGGTGEIADRGSTLYSLTRGYDTNTLSLPVSNYHGLQLFLSVKREAGTTTTPYVEIFGDGLDPKTGLLLYVNDIGTTMTKGPVFFKRGQGASDIMRVHVRHALENFSLWIVGAWK